MAPKKNASQTEVNTAGKKPRVTKSVKAGLIFPVGRVQNNLRMGAYRIGTGGAVFLSAVLEYLSAELLELAGDEAVDDRKHRIIPRHIMMAIKKDKELNELLGDVISPGAGVFIHPVLLPKS